MHTVIIDGADLEYFKQVTRDGLMGGYGELEAVQLYITDEGHVQLGTNGYTSQPFGRPNAPLPQERKYENIEQALEEAEIEDTPQHHDDEKAPEGSGNPYANVPE